VPRAGSSSSSSSSSTNTMEVVSSVHAVSLRVAKMKSGEADSLSTLAGASERKSTRFFSLELILISWTPCCVRNPTVSRFFYYRQPTSYYKTISLSCVPHEPSTHAVIRNWHDHVLVWLLIAVVDLHVGNSTYTMA
jgi:hypothetical protein